MVPHRELLFEYILSFHISSIWTVQIVVCVVFTVCTCYIFFIIELMSSLVPCYLFQLNGEWNSKVNQNQKSYFL